MSGLHQLEPEVQSALNAGRKIDAIKILREQRGIGLKEAKEIVDKYEDQQPLNADGVMPVKSGISFRVIVFMAVVAYAAYYLLDGS